MSSPILDLFSLKDKNVIITGATGGIGLEVTIALAQAGADIVSIEMPRDPSSLELRRAIEATGRRLNVFECNIKDHQSIKETFAAIWNSGIVPDILVNCAGITRIKTIEDTSVQDIDDVRALILYRNFMVLQMLTLRSGHVYQFPRDISGNSRIRSRASSSATAGQNYQLCLHCRLSCSDRNFSVLQ